MSTFVLNEKRPVGISVIEFEMLFFPVVDIDSVVFDFMINEDELLLVFISLIEDCDCC